MSLPNGWPTTVGPDGGRIISRLEPVPEPADADETGHAATAPLAVSGYLLMVPGGTLWHRADCPLVAGKAEAVPVDAKLLASGELGPCPICEPVEETD